MYMKNLFLKGGLFCVLLGSFSSIQAQTDTVTEIRHYDYCSEIIGASNQLYRIVVAGAKGRVATWKDILVTNTRPATAIALSPSGSNFAIGTSRSEVEIWSLEKRNLQLGRLRLNTGEIKALDYSRDSRYLLSAGDDKKIRIWEVKNWELYKTLPCMYAVNAACFSPAGDVVACDQGKDIVVFNYATMSAVQGLNGGHDSRIVKLKFSDEGKYLLSLDENGKVNVWDVVKGEVWRTLKLPVRICAADIQHDNKYLATLDENGELQIRNLKKDSLIQVLDGMEAGRTLHYSYDNYKESALLTHCDKSHCYIWDVTRLEPAFDVMAARMHDARMKEWNRRRMGETSEDYEKRVKDSLMLCNVEVMNEVVTEIGKKWRPLEKPAISQYDRERQGFVVTFPRIHPFFLSVSEEAADEFVRNIENCEYSNPVYTLDARDDFGLSYLEVKDVKANRIYLLDEWRGKQQVRQKVVAGSIVKRVGEEERIFKRKLQEYFDKEIKSRRISDNVKVNVEASPEIGLDENGREVVDYHITYSYEVVRTGEKSVGGWAPGRYLLEESNAASASVQVIRETFEKELAAYIKPGRRVTVRIMGSADGSRIVRPIKYSGLYGDFVGEPYYLNGNMDNVSISRRTGIETNAQLAFLRTYGVRHFIEHEISALEKTNNTFEHYVLVADKNGEEFRRVSIEIIIHEAFRN